MPTKISVLYQKPSFAKKEDFEEPFYCKESPYEVLKELFGKYHIREFNSLKTKWATLQTMPAKSEHKGLEIGNPIYIDGLSVKDIKPKNGFEINGTLKDYNSHLPFNTTYVNKGEEILKEFIENYLITKEVVDSGYATENYNRQKKINRYGKQKAIEYLKQREKEKDPEKEEKLEDILSYGKVVLGEDFNVKKLKKISRKIAKEIPTKIEPIHVDYFTLRPSRYSMFPRGPKLK